MVKVLAILGLFTCNYAAWLVVDEVLYLTTIDIERVSTSNSVGW